MRVRPAVAADLPAALPDAVVVAFALVTLLGNVAAYFLLFSLLYWLGDRTPVVGHRLDRALIAQVVALGFGALALVALLKPLLALPRPPGSAAPVAVDAVPGVLRPVVAEATTIDGYGFPSGHALGSTVVYGGLGWLCASKGDRGPLYAGAAIAAAVSSSRLVVGVHYLGDVVGGIAIGLLWLALAIRFVPTPGRSFPAAGALAGVGVLVAGPTSYLLFAFGGSVGATLAWWALADRIPATARSDREALLTTVVGVATVGWLLGLVAFLGVSAMTLAPAIGLVVAALVAAPAAGVRLDAAFR
ncbi:phosphatase PAP2 family protein [Halorientalis halophila]|uniref:phosphatase PAP2 family protein n=1 Tax=Halorientalis halophila TaxID=3108499 RepID=UPI00300A2B50